MLGATFHKISYGALAGLLLTSCQMTGGASDGRGGLYLPRLRQGATVSAASARLTGTLVRDGACLRVGGNGTTIVVWPLAANAAGRPGYGNVVVVWPRTATLQQRAGGPGTVVVVWPRSVGAGIPVRVGERVALIGTRVDDVAALPLERRGAGGCTGPAFVVRDFRPAGAAEAE